MTARRDVVASRPDPKPERGPPGGRGAGTIDYRRSFFLLHLSAGPPPIGCHPGLTSTNGYNEMLSDLFTVGVGSLDQPPCAKMSTAGTF